MPASNPENSELSISIKSFYSDIDIKNGIQSLRSDGLESVYYGSYGSSVPLFLGALIASITEEVAQQIPLRRRVQLVKTDPRLALAGGSSLFPTTSREVAYRVYGCEFPTDWLAAYSLTYGIGVSAANIYKYFLSKNGHEPATYINQLDLQSTMNHRRVGISLPSIEFEDGKKRIPNHMITFFRNDWDENPWKFIQQQAVQGCEIFGGYALFFERAAKAPASFLGRIDQFIERLLNGYPSINELKEVRDLVNHHFDDISNRNRATLEAQRHGVPILRALNPY